MVFDTELEKLINAVVIIEWEDISGYADSWMDKKDIYDMHPHQCISIAKLYECNQEYITVAATWDDVGSIVSDVNCIPIGCIKSIKKVKL